MNAPVGREGVVRVWASACIAAGLAMVPACAGHAPAAPVLQRGESDAATAGRDAEAWWPVRPDTGAAAATPPHAGRIAAGRAHGAGSDLEDALDPVLSGPPRTPDPARSYLIPALEIVGFEFLLNQYDRRYVSHHTYATNSRSIRRNLHRGWVIDRDPFRMNQFGHPYAGSIYHGFARSAGLDYWESLAYDFAGSALWEVAGERDPPSLNDQITTTFAGSFLGEALFRTAQLVLGGGDDEPGAGRSALAAAISPSSAFNRHVFPGRFDVDGPDPRAATFFTLSVGARRNASIDDVGVLTDLKRDQAAAGFSVDHGMPGTGSRYDRPFDYFHLEATATTSRNAIPENIAVRGLLFGAPYSSGPDHQGIWGLYGSYDYFAPEIFKVSSTALSVGTTAQVLLSPELALQGTGLVGLGFTAAGTGADRARRREFHYGASPQALLALRLVHSDVAMFDVSVNDYVVTGHRGSEDTAGSENILRAQVSLTVRVVDRHAVGIQFVESIRNPRSSRQSVGAVSLFYTFLGDTEFGVVRR